MTLTLRKEDAPTPSSVEAPLSILPPRPRRKRDRAAKQQALLLAAMRLFAAKGYDATTTREIASAAGCAEGLIHRYFKGKAGLLPVLVEQYMDRELGDLNRRLRPAANVEAEFLQLVEWEVERMWENRDFLRAFIPRTLVDPVFSGVMNRSVVRVRTGAIAERLRQCSDCAALSREECEALAQAANMLAFIFGFMRPVTLGHDRLQCGKMAISIAKLLVRGATASSRKTA